MFFGFDIVTDMLGSQSEIIEDHPFALSVGNFSFEGRTDCAAAQGFGQHQNIAGLGASLGKESLRVNQTGDGQPVLWLVVGDGMAPGNHRSGLDDLFRAAPQDLADYLRGHVGRKSAHVQGKNHLAAHSVNIAHGVGRGNGPVIIGIIHHRRKKVDGVDDGLLVIQFVDSSIIGRMQPNQKGGMAVLAK